MLTVAGITKTYDTTAVLRGVSLELSDGAVMALLGPSGCGKTTLLRIIAGLEQADSGAIAHDGVSLEKLPPHRRGFGLMFQDYALFPHMRVAANVAFGLRMQGHGRAAIVARVADMLELVGLGAYGDRRVYQLSGGERQRVALARALAPGPRLLMLDEPLSALDRELRERLQDELRRILRQVGVSALYVTHDQSEAFVLADEVVLLNAGLVEQRETPAQMYRRPASRWAARFLGMSNLVDGHYSGDGQIATPMGTLRTQPNPQIGPGAAALLVAPDAAEVATGPGPNTIAATVISLQFRGGAYRVDVRHISGQKLALDLREPPAAPGEQTELWLDPARLYVLP